MKNHLTYPDFIIESSWEVCNKIGGIYTVLSTRAKTLHDAIKDRAVYVGPDCREDKSEPYFEEDDTLFDNWAAQARHDGLEVRTGRWKIKGMPPAILVNFNKYFDIKNEIYAKLWEDFKVDSLHAYGDYDEASMFSYAAALVAEHLYRSRMSSKKNVVYHCNEWMTALGMMYIRKNVPEIATVFTTHATSIGRSIAGNMKPLYDCMQGFNGDQMAQELNMESKHSVEKQAAHFADCFTTVSDITAKECTQLLEKKPAVVLPNGIQALMAPSAGVYVQRRKRVRKQLFTVANALTGKHFDAETFVVSTSGRYEFRNKGIDMFIDAISRLNNNGSGKEILAVIQVPAWQKGVREDLMKRLSMKEEFDTPLYMPVVTHELCSPENDNVTNMIRYKGLNNNPQSDITIMFVPSYLDGNDGLFNVPYYEMLLASDLCVYPSYYEPWGYTPLEAIAFGVPCITTTLAGFGLWALKTFKKNEILNSGIKVIERTDSNYDAAAEQIKDEIAKCAAFSTKQRIELRKTAISSSEKAVWEKFIANYCKAYKTALDKRSKRIK